MALELRGLRYFVAVAEELHFTRAAERLHLAQPALSEQVKRLEAELGVALLRRTTRRVELTPAGAEFLVRARRILAEADDALAAAGRAARGETGVVRVATGATGGVALVPEILRRFRAERPAVDVELRQSEWGDYLGGLESGTVDAALVWLPIDAGELRVAALHEEPRVAALADGHPLAGNAEVRLEQLLDEPWPWVQTDPAVARFWTCEAERGGPARRGATIRSMEGLLQAVRAGLCVATVPASQPPVPGVVLRPVRGLEPATLAVVWRAPEETPAVAAFVAVARRSAADSSGAPDQ